MFSWQHERSANDAKHETKGETIFSKRSRSISTAGGPGGFFKKGSRFFFDVFPRRSHDRNKDK